MGAVSSPAHDQARWVFPLLLVFMAGLNGVFISFNAWYGDFWHHAALAGALQDSLLPARDPFMPDYPALIPYWPYAAAVACVANFPGLTAIDALVIFSFCNLVFFLFALRRLVRSFAAPDSAVWVLVVLLLGCWGVEPPDFSAFFHVNVFFSILSYPSCFAFSLSLWCYAGFKERIRTNPGADFLFPRDVLLSTLILLIHPLTFIFLCTLVAGLLITRIERPLLPGILRALGFVGVPLLVWLVWPPFPLLRFLDSPSFTSDPSGAWVYLKASETPGIAAFALLLIGWRPWKTADLECSLVILLLIFGYGYFSHNWNYGRCLSFSMTVLHLIVLRELFDRKSAASRFQQMRRILCISIVCFSSLYFLLNLGALFAVQSELQHREEGLSSRLVSLHRNFGSDGLIMAETDISKILPAMRGTVFVFDVAPFFRGEHAMRTRVQQRFFDPRESTAGRLQITKDYEIRSVIIDRRIPIQSEIRAGLVTSPDVQEQDLGSDFSLLKIGNAARR